MESIPDNVYFKDRNSRFIVVSDYMVRRMGLGCREDLLGKSDFDIFSPEHAQPAFDDEQSIIRTGCPMLNVEEKEVHPGGEVTWVSTTKLPLRNAAGTIVGTYGFSRDITMRKELEGTLARTQAELNSTSRLAGMAEISSGVLHNIGNALNSVITTTALLSEHLAKSRIGNLGRVAAMIEEHSADLGKFISEDPKGKQLPGYLVQLSHLLVAEHKSINEECDSLRKSVEHIKEIVLMQQNYARVSHFEDDVDPVSLMEEALHISESSLCRHSITVARDFMPVPPVRVIRHKVLQILVNLIRNAKIAMDESSSSDKKLTLILRTSSAGEVEFAVRDNGVGIPQENMEKLFGFGFTTRKDGHGFGLHSSLGAAKEMNGTLTANSQGPGKGATFVLSLPASMS
jgi:PAS domain S-box-containing protein